VLRPDKIRELQPFTPIISIYISQPGLSPETADDHTTVAYQPLCTYQVVNHTGELDLAVSQVLGIIHTGGRHV
jgi:hypothetical protein